MSTSIRTPYEYLYPKYICTVFCRTKSNTVPMRQKITRYRYWQRAPLHIHTPRAARNRKEVQSIKSALSSIFGNSWKKKLLINPRLTFFRKHLKQEDIFGHYTRNLEKHKCFQMRPHTVWKTLSTSWSMVSISIISNEIRTIWLLVVETEIIDYYILIDRATYKTYQEYYYGRKIIIDILLVKRMKTNINYRYENKFNYHYQHAIKRKFSTTGMQY